MKLPLMGILIRIDPIGLGIPHVGMEQYQISKNISDVSVLI
jgi:hypothetical protein